MDAVGQIEPDVLVALREVLQALHEVGTGLFVLEGADEEGRHLDPLDPLARSAIFKQLRGPVRVLLDQRVEVLGLQSQLLVGRALGVVVRAFRIRQDAGVGLRALFGSRPGVLRPLGDPAEGEALVEDPARIARARVDVVGHRQRCDGGQARRLGSGGEQLTDAGEGDPSHADLAALDPVLGGDGLDGVVAVIGGRQAEQVERATGAARTAHLHRDDRVAQQRADDRTHRGRGSRSKRV